MNGVRDVVDGVIIYDSSGIYGNTYTWVAASTLKETWCSDDIDNDNDGKTDCDDIDDCEGKQCDVVFGDGNTGIVYLCDSAGECEDGVLKIWGLSVFPI